MSKYVLNKKIKSTYVSLVLLREIEKCLLEQANNQRNEDSHIEYMSTIYDKYGEECINSFENYQRSTLPNEAKRIKLFVIDYHKFHNAFQIEVSFSKEATYSYLRIQVVDKSAKEKAIGIVNTIDSQLNEHKNLNFIFHSWLSYLIPTPMSFALFWIIIDIKKNRINMGTIVCSLIMFVGVAFFCLKIVNPYSVLDTNRNRQIASFSKWVLNGLAGVFLFGLLATLVRIYLFGF